MILDLDDLPEAPPILEGVLEPAQKATAIDRQLEANERLGAIQDSILTECGQIIQDTLHFAKIPADTVAPPAEWIAELGEARAWERYRTAQYGLMNAKEAPVAMKVAHQVYVGIVKAKATEKGGPVRLNVEKVYMTIPAPKFPELEVHSDE